MLDWAVAHRMTMMVANQAHRDTRVARDEYVAVFEALKRQGICCVAQPMRRLAGAYFGPESDGPAVLLNSGLDEVTLRHTAAHELGHHVLGHGTRTDERVDPDGGSLTGALPDEEKLAEAFAAWFLMPLPAIQAAIERTGTGPPTAPGHVHQIACWLGTSFAGTARHLVNVHLATAQQAADWVRVWRAKSARIRTALGGQGPHPEGRVWTLGLAAHQARLHVIQGDTLVFGTGELPDHLPLGLAIRSDQQMSLESRSIVVITDSLTSPTQLIAKTPRGPEIVITVIPPPSRQGIDTAWHQREDRSGPHLERS